MPIPKNIIKEDIDKAITEINQTEIPDKRLSRDYFLIDGDRKLPPKYVISLANKYSNHEELDSNSFNAVEAKNYLSKLGYKIIHSEMDYFEELKKFLSQSETNSLGTSDYINSYQGLSVKVSFGKGNKARIPWIAFVGQEDSVQQGVYPVYLYYKDRKHLILAYGVSETHSSSRKWNLKNGKTINQYFAEKGFGIPERYGSSFVFKSYDIYQGIDEQKINRDLNELISIYKAMSTTTNNSAGVKNFQYRDFLQSVTNSGLFFNYRTSLRFAASLLTKPFVILTGLSGSGKTKLAHLFASWICEDERQFCIVPVGADWTNRDPLLGFPNALKNSEYVKPDNKVLDLIVEANKNSGRPYFLILDEMNLSHVERYFADFLSVMESNGKISLHSGKEDWSGIPSQISLPDNLFVIGTVNIDETTYMFSPKVLDRANVLEFRVTLEEMDHYLSNGKPLDLNSLKSNGANMAAAFIEIARDKSLAPAGADELNKVLVSFFAELMKAGAEFGYRSASEIRRFAAVVNKLEPQWSLEEIVDAAIMQKLLPKVHGSRRKLEPVLKTLGGLCLNNRQEIDEFLSPKTEVNFHDKEKIKYPISLEKILRMYNNLISNGFTSYAEA